MSGIKEAIAAAYPLAEYQRCIVHMVRNTLKYAADKDKKSFANDLKTIYHAPDEQTALRRLEEVGALPGDLGLTKKWILPVRNWGQVYAELAIMYPGRLSGD